MSMHVKYPFEIETKDGLYRVVFAESRFIDDEKQPVVYGPWCISHVTALRWWDESETADEMRRGRRPAKTGARQ